MVFFCEHFLISMDFSIFYCLRNFTKLIHESVAEKKSRISANDCKKYILFHQKSQKQIAIFFNQLVKKIFKKQLQKKNHLSIDWEEKSQISSKDCKKYFAKNLSTNR